MRTFRALLPALAGLATGLAQAAPSWVLPRSLPTFVGVDGQYSRAVFKVVPGQPADTPLKELNVYSFYGEGRVLPIKEAAQKSTNWPYFDEWEKVSVEDVSALVPAKGWKWDDGRKSRPDKLGMALVAKAPTTIRNGDFSGYGRLDWSGAAAVSLGSGAKVIGTTFRDNAAGGLRLTGKNNLVQDCVFDGNLVRTSDQGQLYIEGRGKGGATRVKGCTFTDDPASRAPAKAWGGNDSWRRYGIHIDDGASDVVIEDCTFTNLDGAIGVNGGTNVVVKGCTLANCRLDLDAVGKGTITFVDCVFDGRRTTAKLRRADNPRIVVQGVP